MTGYLGITSGEFIILSVVLWASDCFWRVHTVWDYWGCLLVNSRVTAPTFGANHGSRAPINRYYWVALLIIRLRRNPNWVQGPLSVRCGCEKHGSAPPKAFPPCSEHLWDDWQRACGRVRRISSLEEGNRLIYQVSEVLNLLWSITMQPLVDGAFVTNNTETYCFRGSSSSGPS